MEARGKLCRIRSDPNQRRALLFGSLTMIEGNEIFVCLFCFVFFRFRLMTDSGQNNEGDVGIRETQNQWKKNQMMAEREQWRTGTEGQRERDRERERERTIETIKIISQRRRHRATTRSTDGRRPIRNWPPRKRSATFSTSRVFPPRISFLFFLFFLFFFLPT